MYQLILIIHVLIAACLIGLVLIQQGKGATMGAAFGGASQTVFGSRGSGSFLMRITIGLAVVFFSTSIALNYVASQAVKHQKAIELPQPDDAIPAPSSPQSLPASAPAPVEAGNKK